MGAAEPKTDQSILFPVVPPKNICPLKRAASQALLTSICPEKTPFVAKKLPALSLNISVFPIAVLDAPIAV